MQPNVLLPPSLERIMCYRISCRGLRSEHFLVVMYIYSVYVSIYSKIYKKKATERKQCSFQGRERFNEQIDYKLLGMDVLFPPVVIEGFKAVFMKGRILTLEGKWFSCEGFFSIKGTAPRSWPSSQAWD